VTLPPLRRTVPKPPLQQEGVIAKCEKVGGVEGQVVLQMELLELAPGDDLRQFLVAFTIPNNNDHTLLLLSQFHPHQRLNPRLTAAKIKLHHAVKTVSIRETERLHVILHSKLHQLGNGMNPLQKSVVTLADN
jgi:hypothetical protein